MTQEDAEKLLQKYLAGEANQNEIDKVEIWYSSLSTDQVVSVERKLQIAKKMELHIQRAIRSKKAKTTILYHSWFKIAALLFVILSIGAIFWKTSHSNSESNRMLTAFTGANERKEIILPDSSIVILEPATKITYPAYFSSANRVVKLLIGEAFFTVTHQPERTFLVKLPSNLQVKVLGTSFRIRNRIHQSMLKVTVSTGKVAVHHGGQQLGILLKGQELSYDKKSGQHSIGLAAKPQTVKLLFDGSSLAEVIQKMEYTYSIKIQVNNPRFLKLKCTAAFNSGQPPSEILDILCSLHHLRFAASKDHKTFKIYK